MSANPTFLGRPVRSLQTMLRWISATVPEIPPVIPDGIYGESTMRSVTALQRYVRLPATGVADLATWNEVVALFYDVAEQLLPPQPLEPYFRPGQTIVPGENNLYVNLFQSMFVTLNIIYENVPGVEVNGTYDELLTAAIRWLQALSGLPMTGEVDRRTWRYLAGLYRLAVFDGKYPTA